MNLDQLLLFGLVAGGLGGVGLFSGRYLANRSLNCRVRLSPQTLQVSGPLAVNLKLYPRSPVTVDRIELTLTCLETRDEDSNSLFGYFLWEFLDALSGRRSWWSSNSSSETTTICKETTVFPQQRTFPAYQAESLDLELRLPDNGVGSLNYGERQVKWSLEVRFCIPNAPDAVRFVPLQVAPRYA